MTPYAHRRRVVVAGLGIVSLVTNSVQEAWASLVASRSGIARITRFDASALSTRFAGEVKNFNVESYLAAKDARHMDRFIHFGLTAGSVALALVSRTKCVGLQKIKPQGCRTNQLQT